MMSNEQKKEPVTGTPAEKAAEEAAKTAQDAAEALQNLAAAVDPESKRLYYKTCPGLQQLCKD